MIYSQFLKSPDETTHLKVRDNSALEKSLTDKWHNGDYEAGLALADLNRSGRETNGFKRDCNFAYHLYEEISKVKPKDDLLLMIKCLAYYSMADMFIDNENFVEASLPKRVGKAYENCLKAQPYGKIFDIFAVEGLAILEGLPEHNLFGEKDAFRMFDFGISKGSIRCLFEKGIIMCIDPADVDRRNEGVGLIVQAAKEGYPVAQVELALSAFSENNPNLPLEDAYKLMQSAAFQNHAQANYNCAVALFKGIGIDQDSDKALQYLEIAVQLGDPDAINLTRKIEEYIAREQRKNSMWSRIKRGLSAGAKPMAEGVTGEVSESLMESLVRNLLN